MGSAPFRFLVQHFFVTTRGGVIIDYRMVDIRNTDLARIGRATSVSEVGVFVFCIG
jgi:hypothetical protein